MMNERSVPVDHSTIYRWVKRFAPKIEKQLRWQWRRPLCRCDTLERRRDELSRFCVDRHPDREYLSSRGFVG